MNIVNVERIENGYIITRWYDEDDKSRQVYVAKKEDIGNIVDEMI